MKVIINAQKELTTHPVYETLTDIEALRKFMSVHVFAVWDFMSLLKSLQNKVTCVEVPWRPSLYPAQIVRMINQIVLGEESDVDGEGNALSHFELYLDAMEEVGSPTGAIKDFLTDFNFDCIPAPAKKFVKYNLEVATTGHVVEVASSFFYGREKLIPEMFEAIVQVLHRENIHAPKFLYYLKRHIEVDGDEHGPVAQKCLDILIGNDEKLKSLAQTAGLNALAQRKFLWDELHMSLTGKVST